MERERLGSRLGFILLSAGCAIGLGNVWMFPYRTGQNGGAVFVLFYLLFLVIMGIPVMTMEFALGRASQKSPARLYHALEPKGSKWHIHSYAALAGNYLLMMFYTSVTGWLLKYGVGTAAGDFEGLDKKGIETYFASIKADPLLMVILVAIVVCLGFFVCSFSLQKGIERITKYMMSALLVIMVVLAINSCFLPGGAEGLKFYLVPDFNKVQEVGLLNVIVAAMNQSFFTLSLGIGSMAIFGSYIGKERALMGESVRVAVLDTFVAITSGLIIFPACFSYDVDVNAGPDLIFITLPHVFNNLPFGRVWGTLFFVFLIFAAFSTVLAIFENLISCTKDLFGWSRKKASLINCAIMFVLALPCALGTNLLSFIKPFGAGSNIMDFEDFLVSNLLLPLGSLTFIMFCSHKFGWGWKNFIKEANTGKGLKFPEKIRPYIAYVLPVVVFALFILGLYSFFA
ncbi:MAG: sodium-dependent transporter [Ruminococcaceae bacterium]|nr:sodium-dependent transporter [Oscillospiraceae bacterium]